jgi:hypothetical protein
MENEVSKVGGEQGEHDHRLVITVHDEDAGGEPIKIEGKPESRISTIIEELYDKLHTERKPDDRLQCLAGGNDVFAHGHEELHEYAKHVCPALVWTFARGTGGA